MTASNVTAYGCKKEDYERFILTLLETVETHLDYETRCNLGMYMESFADELGMDNVVEKLDNFIIGL